MTVVGDGVILTGVLVKAVPVPLDELTMLDSTDCFSREVVATLWSWMELEEPSTGVLLSTSLTIVVDGVGVEGTIEDPEV